MALLSTLGCMHLFGPGFSFSLNKYPEVGLPDGSSLKLLKDVHDKESFGTRSECVRGLREACDWNRRWGLAAFLKGAAPRPNKGRRWAPGLLGSPRAAVGSRPADRQRPGGCGVSPCAASATLRPASAPLLEFQARQRPQCRRLPSWLPPLFRKRVAFGQFLSFVPT